MEDTITEQEKLKLQKEIIKLIKKKEDKKLCYLIDDLYLSPKKSLNLDVFNSTPSIKHVFSSNEKFFITNKMVENDLSGAILKLWQKNFCLSSFNFKFEHNKNKPYHMSLEFYLRICIFTLVNTKQRGVHSVLENSKKREEMELDFYSLVCCYPKIFDGELISPLRQLDRAIFDFLFTYSIFFKDSPLISLITEKLNPNNPKHFDLIKKNTSILLNKCIQKDPKHFEYVCQLILSREQSDNIFLTNYVREYDDHKFENSSLDILNRLLPTSIKNIVDNKASTESGFSSKASLAKNFETEKPLSKNENPSYYQIYFSTSGEMIVEFKEELIKIDLKSPLCSFKEESDCFIFYVNSETFNLYKNNFKDYEAIKKFHLKVKDFFNPKSSLKIKIS